VPIPEQDFANCVAAVADVEVISGVRPTYFEIMTASAFRYFADEAVDVAVIEVGMLGRWDATNVVQSHVAVITNIDLDHTEFAGPTLADIAREKVGISKPSSTLVVGDVNDDLNPIWAGAPSRGLVRRIEHFECIGNELAVGGRLLDVSTPRGVYRDVMVPLHGRHQGDNASIAIVAIEEFFDAPINEDVLREGMASVEMPGRFEVLGHHPLVIIDGAHNPAGADVCSAVFFDDFSPVGRRILVVGTLKGRDPELTLGALRVDDFDVVVTCTAPSPRGLESAVLAATARSMGCDEVLECTSVEDACARALSIASEDDAVLVAGSLYVVGSARTTLRRSL
jgi:dihydrofolate synthase/folylpolyglutamate synthase